MAAAIRAYVRQHHLALVAIFLALTGTAVALPGKNKVDSGDIKNGQVRTNDLALSSVASAQVLNGGLLGEDFAPGALPDPDTPAQVLAKLLTVDGAGSGLDADSVDGGGEAYHEIEPTGTAGGEPDFGTGWSNLGGAALTNQGLWSTAAFYRDPLGIVHLKGVVQNASPSQFTAIFNLPAGYRPNKTTILTGATDGTSPPANPMMFLIGTNSQPAIGGPGDLLPFSVGNSWISLDGIGFRCAPSGADGCP